MCLAQFFIMVGGIVVALWYAMRELTGGFREAWDVAEAEGRLRWINTDFDLTQRYVFWTLIVYGIGDFLGNKGIEQMNVQRFVSARSPFNAKMAMLIQSLFTMPVWLLLFGVGIGLFAYYRHDPSPEVAQFIAAKQYDRIFPHFIYSVMPVGLRGLMGPGVPRVGAGRSIDSPHLVLLRPEARGVKVSGRRGRGKRRGGG